MQKIHPTTKSILMQMLKPSIFSVQRHLKTNLIILTNYCNSGYRTDAQALKNVHLLLLWPHPATKMSSLF